MAVDNPISWSLERLSELHGDPTDVVYRRLFQRRPELEELFVLDRNGAIRGNMLAQVFAALMDLEGPRVYGLNFFRAERVNHEGGLGVTPTAYADFLTVVLDTVREALGPEWTPRIEASWRKALDEIAAA